MNGFKAFKYYTAIRLHFSSDKFDVFSNKGHVRGTFDTFCRRNDRALFERVARHHSTDKECIQFIASNFMYDNPELVYDLTTAESNYREFLRRRQSMTKIFSDDLDIIIRSGARYEPSEFAGRKIPDVVQLYLAKRITLETLVILNEFDGFVPNLKQSVQTSLLLDGDLRKIAKSRGFVKFDPYKVMGPYQNFLEEIQGYAHGQDVQPLAEQV